MNIQDWFPLGWTGWISLQSKGLSRVFSSATVQRHQFFSAQYFLLSSSHIYAAAKSLQSCPTLCDPIDGSPPGSPVPGILQARILEWVAISFSNASKWKMKVKSLSHVPLLDCSLPGSCVHGIFQARVLEWGAIAFPIYTWLLKNHSFDYMDLCWQSTLWFLICYLGLSQLFFLGASVFYFLPAATVCNDLKPKKIVCHCFHCFPIYLPWSDGTGCHDLHFLNVEF